MNKVLINILLIYMGISTIKCSINPTTTINTQSFGQNMLDSESEFHWAGSWRLIFASEIMFHTQVKDATGGIFSINSKGSFHITSANEKDVYTPMQTNFHNRGEGFISYKVERFTKRHGQASIPVYPSDQTWILVNVKYVILSFQEMESLSGENPIYRKIRRSSYQDSLDALQKQVTQYPFAVNAAVSDVRVMPFTPNNGSSGVALISYASDCVQYASEVFCGASRSTMELSHEEWVAYQDPREDRKSTWNQSMPLPSRNNTCTQVSQGMSSCFSRALSCCPNARLSNQSGASGSNASSSPVTNQPTAQGPPNASGVRARASSRTASP